LGAKSAREIWDTALGELQVQVNKTNYRTWLENTTGVAHQDKQFLIGAPNTFIAEYLDKNLRSLIQKTLMGLTGEELNISFCVGADGGGSFPGRELLPVIPGTGRLNPRYTFDTFVVGNSNRLAHASALEVALNPGATYNPLYIYGGVGLGKTHLLQAVGHMGLGKKLKVLYVSGEQFCNEFVSALRERRAEDFRQKFRSADMLLLDDISFISGKEQTEECFFHTFNELHNANRQIVITSNQNPKSLPELSDRLRSRLEWGLIVDVQSPDRDTRLEILRTKAERDGAQMTPDVLDFIAQNIQQNIRELEGSLNRVVAYARLLKAVLTPQLAAQALKNIATQAPDAVVTPAMVIETVATNFQLTTPDLLGRKRDGETALARQVAMYLLKKEYEFSMAEIGRELGNRDPSTVSHAYEKINGELEESPYLRRKVADIQREITSRKQLPA
jgi:chromosomal replication initiator protein